MSTALLLKILRAPPPRPILTLLSPVQTVSEGLLGWLKMPRAGLCARHLFGVRLEPPRLRHTTYNERPTPATPGTSGDITHPIHAPRVRSQLALIPCPPPFAQRVHFAGNPGFVSQKEKITEHVTTPCSQGATQTIQGKRKRYVGGTIWVST